MEDSKKHIIIHTSQLSTWDYLILIFVVYGLLFSSCNGNPSHYKELLQAITKPEFPGDSISK